MEAYQIQFYINSKSVERYLNCLTIRIANFSNHSELQNNAQNYLPTENVPELYEVMDKASAVTECISANSSYNTEMLSSCGRNPTMFLRISIFSKSTEINSLNVKE